MTMLTFADLRQWDSTRLDDASEQLKSDLDILEKAKDELDTQAIPDSWWGLPRVFAELRRKRLLDQIETFIDETNTFEKTIFGAAPSVKAISTIVTDIDADAKIQELDVAGDGTVRDVEPPQTFATQEEADAHTAARKTLMDTLVTRIEDVLDRATQVDSILFQARPTNPWNPEAPGENEGTVDPVVEREWSQMSDDERRAVLEQITQERADEAGVDVELSFEDLEDEDGDGVDDDPTTDSRGYKSGNRVVLDINDLDDPQLINTVAHEVRHAEQAKAIDELPTVWDRIWGNDDYTPPPGATREEVEAWKENDKDYKSTDEGDTFEEYWEQPLEVDARDAGGEYLDDYTPDDLEEDRS